MMKTGEFSIITEVRRVREELRDHLDEFDWRKLNYVTLKFLEEKEKCTAEEATMLSKRIKLSKDFYDNTKNIAAEIVSRYIHQFEDELSMLRRENDYAKDKSHIG